MFKISIGDKAFLALLEFRHAREMWNLINDNRSHLRKWLPWVDLTRNELDCKQWIQGALKQFAENRELHAGIWSDQGMAGIIGLKLIWQNRSGMIGYWLGSDYQGRGLITNACKALLHYSFADLSLNRVEIRCAVENGRSRAVPLRLGFQEEGTIRAAEWLCDHYVDHVIYGLLAEEWRQRYKENSD